MTVPVWLLKKPCGHEVHVNEPGSDANEPAWHDWHAEAPIAFAKVLCARMSGGMSKGK